MYVLVNWLLASQIRKSGINSHQLGCFPSTPWPHLAPRNSAPRKPPSSIRKACSIQLVGIPGQVWAAKSHFSPNRLGGRTTCSQTEKAVFFQKANILHTLGYAGIVVAVPQLNDIQSQPASFAKIRAIPLLRVWVAPKIGTRRAPGTCQPNNYKRVCASLAGCLYWVLFRMMLMLMLMLQAQAFSCSVSSFRAARACIHIEC